MENFRLKTISGIKWSVVSQIGQQLLRFIIGIILAQLLSPEEFGLVAMITVITGFATTFSELGLSSALIHKQDATQEHYSSIFWINILVGLLLTAFFIISAPFIAKFYDQKILTPLTIFLSMTFVTGSLNIVQSTLLKKELNFKVISIINITAVGFSGTISIIMALNKFGVWSLATQPLLQSTTAVVLHWTIGKWRPKFLFKWKAVKDVLKFSLNLLGFQTYNYWVRNIDNLLIGKYLGSDALGVYNRAYAIMLFPLQNISRVISQVMFPSLSIIQKDKLRVKSIFTKMTSTIALFTFPLMIGLFVLVDPFVYSLFGHQWKEMIPILRIFSILGMFQSIGTLNGNLYLSQGRTDLQFKVGLIFSSITIIAILIGLKHGILGVASAYAIASISCYFPGIIIVGSLVNLSFLEYWKNLVGILFCSCLMGVTILFLLHFFFSHLTPWLQLIILVPIGIILYLAILHFVKLKAYIYAKNIVIEQIKLKFSK